MENNAIDRLKSVMTDRRMPAVAIHALTPDASTREYFRVRWNDQSAIACVYPTDEAGRAQFEACLDVTELFLGAGLPVAKVIFEDSGHLVIIHQDFGDSILRDRLEAADPETREMYLDDAIRIIARIQAATGLAFERNSVASRLRFDFEKLAWEFSFFTEHYFRSLTGRDPESIPAGFKTELDAVADELALRACVLTHRDFHAANLMLLNGELRIIDHQDARIGSPSYDLVSLLLDRVTELPDAGWLAAKRDLLLAEREALGLDAIGRESFANEFRLQTVQRCLKAIGTFSYQSAFRGKTHFERYIGPMFGIVLRAAKNIGTFPVIESVIAEELKRQS